MTSDPEVFEAVLKSEKEEELDSKTLYTIRQANIKVLQQQYELNCWLIEKSLTNNTIYGGACKFEGEDVKNINSFLKELEPELFEILLEKANKLSFPSEVEVKEVK